MACTAPSPAGHAQQRHRRLGVLTESLRPVETAATFTQANPQGRAFRPTVTGAACTYGDSGIPQTPVTASQWLYVFCCQIF